MTKQDLINVLERHNHWIHEDCPGWENMKADLSGADLSGVNLSGIDLFRACLSGANLFRANLSRAHLSGVNLFGACLSGANLSEATLSEATLSVADLSGANLSGADLFSAYLSGANLSEANLSGANLLRADLSQANLSKVILSEAQLYRTNISEKDVIQTFPLCCPDTGSFIGWKSAGSAIIKLEIPEYAKRSSAYGRKCRASAAKVISIENEDGTPFSKDEIRSDWDLKFIYRIGEVVSVSDFDEDRRNECSTGIHFFITRIEAVNWKNRMNNVTPLIHVENKPIDLEGF